MKKYLIFLLAWPLFAGLDNLDIDQAIAMLMSVMKAPIEKFVRTIKEPHAKLVRTVAAVRDQKNS